MNLLAFAAVTAFLAWRRYLDDDWEGISFMIGCFAGAVLYALSLWMMG